MITHHWINTQELTSSISVYDDFFRLMVKLIPIEILRNQYDANAGLYLVCDTEVIKQTTMQINQTIKVLEGKVNAKRFNKSSTHLSEKKANYRIKLVKDFIKRLMGEADYSLSAEDQVEYDKNKALIKEYISQIPQLRILKPFRAKP